MTRPTASQITDDQLDELYARLDRLSRAVNRVDAAVDSWAADRTPITRGEAAELFGDLIDLGAWEQSDPQPALRVVPGPSKEPVA